MDPASRQYGPEQRQPGTAPGWAAPPPPAEGYGAGGSSGGYGGGYGGGYAPPRARTGLIVLVTVLTELVIIAAAGNQWVSDKIVRNELRTNNQALRQLANSWLTYTWRFSPRPGLTDTWWSQIALVLTVLVVSGLLVYAVVRGPITFGRAFIGTWMAVLVATLVGAFVRGLIEPNSQVVMRGAGRLTRAVYSGFGLNPQSIAAGFVLGLAVALVTAIVAVTTRRPGTSAAEETARGALPPYVAPEQPPPFFGDPARPAAPQGSEPPPWQDQRYGPPAGHTGPGPSFDTAATTQFRPQGGEQPPWPPPRREVADEPTQAAPPASADQPTQAVAPQSGDRPPQTPPQSGDRPPQTPPPTAEDQPTTQFPRPPDDEDLGSVDPPADRR